MNDISEKLKHSTPSLLDPSQWPMSRGSWKAEKRYNTQVFCAPPDQAVIQCHGNKAVQDARYIAALSPDVVVPMWWEEYQYHYNKMIDIDFEIGEYEDGSEPAGELAEQYQAENKLALTKLTRLNSIGVILWTPRA